MSLVTSFALLTALVSGAPAQGMTAHQKSELLINAAEHIRKSYVLAEAAPRVAAALRTWAESDQYAHLSEPSKFAAAVEKDLRAASNDIHLSFFHDPALFKSLTESEQLSSRERKQRDEADRAKERSTNFGFGRIDRLEGNVGYLEITRFSGYTGDEAGATATAAMAYLANVDAMIIDLRRNPGGSGRMGQLLSSYFFAADDDRWLVSNENRSKGTLRQEWTQPYVPGARRPHTPLYILVSSRTGSAAEGFAYNLQALGRATIVGDKTAGGAHSGSYIPLSDGFVMFLPVGRTINPITQTNWEGTGVRPDIRADPKQALERAHLLALGKLVKEEQTPGNLLDLKWAIDVLRSQLEPENLPSEEPARLVGIYEDADGITTISAENGSLFYQYGKKRYPLVPVGSRVFIVKGYEMNGPNAGRLTFSPETGAATEIRLEIRHAPGQIATFSSKRRAGS